MSPADLPGERVTPRWIITVLLAGLSTLGPFSIDTYFPAFNAIAADLKASPLEMQQTLSIYLLGFAVMLLFHGALSDAFGRRPVVLVSLVVFAGASVACALSTSIHTLILWRLVQGLSAGAGIHGGDELKAGREVCLPRRAGDGDAARFERFAQHFQHAAIELG